MKKHLCFVTKYYGVPKNGPSTFAHNLVERLLKDKNIDLTIVSGEQCDSVNEQNVFYYKPSNHIFDGFKIRNLIKQIHRKKNIDIIYFNCFRNAIFSTGLGIPYILNVNDHHPFIKKRWNIWKFFAPNIFKNAKVNFFNSKFTKEKIESSLGLYTSITEVTYKGINLSDFEYSFSNIEDKLELLYVGSDFYRKGLDIIIEALGKLKYNSNLNFNLKVIGEDPKLNEVFLPKVKEYNLINEIEFLGRQGKGKVIQHQKNAHILLLPSRQEAFGVVLLESLASGTNVIASNVGGIPTIISNKENGILMGKNDSNALYNSILYLTKHKDLRKKMAESGKETVKQFDFDLIYNRILSHLT